MSKQFNFEAIGTHFWIEIFDDISDEELQATQRRLELLCSLFNEQYSRFRPNSLISILNRERVLHNPSAECIEQLSYGKALYLRTNTTFNILTGHILEARGYDASYSFTPKENLGSLKICNPLTDLIISNSEITLTCGNVDTGGYGKGWLVDMIKEDLFAHNIKYFLINGGGDMYATSDNEQPVTIYLEHPNETGKYLTETTLFNQGFAASSPFKRQWKYGDTIHTHIVSEGDVPMVAAFAKASTATDADAFTKPCLLLNESQLLNLSKDEGVSFARFNPQTNELWHTRNFSMYN